MCLCFSSCLILTHPTALLLLLPPAARKLLQAPVATPHPKLLQAAAASPRRKLLQTATASAVTSVTNPSTGWLYLSDYEEESPDPWSLEVSGAPPALVFDRSGPDAGNPVQDVLGTNTSVFSYDGGRAVRGVGCRGCVCRSFAVFACLCACVVCCHMQPAPWNILKLLFTCSQSSIRHTQVHQHDADCLLSLPGLLTFPLPFAARSSPFPGIFNSFRGVYEVKVLPQVEQLYLAVLSIRHPNITTSFRAVTFHVTATQNPDVLAAAAAVAAAAATSTSSTSTTSGSTTLTAAQIGPVFNPLTHPTVSLLVMLPRLTAAVYGGASQVLADFTSIVTSTAVLDGPEWVVASLVNSTPVTVNATVCASDCFVVVGMWAWLWFAGLWVTL